jgi:hypothetical protein
VATGTGFLADTFGFTNENPLYIGNRADFSTVPFDGFLDDVAVFDGPLPPAQIAAIRDGDFSAFGVGGGGGGGGEPFRITGVTRDAGSGAVTLTWISRPGRTYQVWWSTSLQAPWGNLDDNVASGGTTTSFTDSILAPTGSSPDLYYYVSEDPAN